MFLKRTVAYLFLVIFSYASLGYYLTFVIQQYHTRKDIKRMIKQGVPKEQLVKLAFDISTDEYKELEWKKKDEFRYNGQMYDVVYKYTDENGIIHYECISDTQEEKLFANLESLVENSMMDTTGQDSSKSSSGKTAKKISKDYFNKYYSFIPDESIAGTVFFQQPHLLYIDVFQDVLTPPPDITDFGLVYYS